MKDIILLVLLGATYLMPEAIEAKQVSMLMILYGVYAINGST